MPPDSGREANRSRNGRASFCPFPRPARPRVDRDTLLRDSRRVWVATYLGFVEVHFGHLMQRRAGWPPGFLPVAFFIAFPLMGRSASRADDADRVLGLHTETNKLNPSLLVRTDVNR